MLSVSAERLKNEHATYYEIVTEMWFDKKLKHIFTLLWNWKRDWRCNEIETDLRYEEIETDLRYEETEAEIYVTKKLKQWFTLLRNWNRDLHY